MFPTYFCPQRHAINFIEEAFLHLVSMVSWIGWSRKSLHRALQRAFHRTMHKNLQRDLHRALHRALNRCLHTKQHCTEICTEQGNFARGGGSHLSEMVINKRWWSTSVSFGDHFHAPTFRSQRYSMEISMQARVDLSYLQYSIKLGDLQWNPYFYYTFLGYSKTENVFGSICVPSVDDQTYA